jgi:hypothetical protein
VSILPAHRGIEKVVCNDDLWYLRLGTRLGWYRPELTHSTVKGGVMAVPRNELAYWQARLEELEAGTLEDGPARGMFVHESVHVRQMSRWPFWLFGLFYILSKRFRRRVEEEAYTVHLTCLAECGIPLAPLYWMDHFQQLYFGAFNEGQARETFDRIAAVVRERVPNARIEEEAGDSEGPPSCAPWPAET